MYMLLFINGVVRSRIMGFSKCVNVMFDDGLGGICVRLDHWHKNCFYLFLIITIGGK